MGSPRGYARAGYAHQVCISSHSLTFYASTTTSSHHSDNFGPSLEGSGRGDGDLGLGLCQSAPHRACVTSPGLTARVGALALNLLDEVLALDDLAEDDVLAVEPRGDDGGDEELGSVGVGSGVGHRQEEGLVVLELEVLIGELVAVDRLSTSAVVVGELWVSLALEETRALTSPP